MMTHHSPNVYGLRRRILRVTLASGNPTLALAYREVPPKRERSAEQDRPHQPWGHLVVHPLTDRSAVSTVGDTTVLVDAERYDQHRQQDEEQQPPPASTHANDSANTTEPSPSPGKVRSPSMPVAVTSTSWSPTMSVSPEAQFTRT